MDCAIGRRFETSQTEAFQQQSAVYREALGYRGYGIFERIALELVDYAVVRRRKNCLEAKKFDDDIAGSIELRANFLLPIS